MSAETGGEQWREERMLIGGAPVEAADGDDDAVAVAYDPVYGPSGAVFSGSAERASGVAARMRTGTAAAVAHAV